MEEEIMISTDLSEWAKAKVDLISWRLKKDQQEQLKEL